jgi:hypothetical protein
MGSPAVGAWIAQAAFWILMARGWASGELGVKGLAIFLVLWLGGFFAIPPAPFGASLFAPYVACLDVALVILILKGDVPMS